MTTPRRSRSSEARSRRIVAALLLLLLLLLITIGVPQAGAQAVFAPVEGEITAENIVFGPEDFRATGVGFSALFRVARPRAEFLRLRIDARNAPASGRVRIAPHTAVAPKSYSFVEIVEAGEFWSAPVPGANAIVTVEAPTLPTDFELEVVEIFAQSGQPIRSLALIGKDSTTPLNDPETSALAKTLAGSVARLTFKLDGSFRRCSGFLIAENRLLTNAHCIPDAGPCATLDAIFGYEEDTSGYAQLGDSYRCRRIVAVDQLLDLSLVELRGSPGDRWGIAGPNWSTPQANTKLILIQHMGEASDDQQRALKRVSEKDCAVSGTQGAHDADFAHSCDTEGGSSGSPVFDTHGTLVGVHYAALCGDTACTPSGTEVEANVAVFGNVVEDWLEKVKEKSYQRN